MNIRRQLLISNLMMIVIPVLAAAIAGLCCIGMIWHVMRHGSGVGVDDAADFSWLARLSISYVHDVIADEELASPPDPLSQLIDANTMYLVVTKDGKEVYTYGVDAMYDSEMLSAADGVDGSEVIMSQDGRNLYLARMDMEDGSYEVFLFAEMQDMETRAFHAAAAVTWVVLICTILLSVFLTNRFIIRSLFRRIGDPLKKLSRGARELGDGNLDFRISYDRDDEFTPVCLLFNTMAGKLKDLVSETQRDEESRKELIAGISHDLRSPLTSIQAYVEGLEDGVASTPEMQKSYLSVIKNKVRDIDALVSQLFLFSKLDLSDYPVSVAPVGISGFIAEFAGRHSAEYEERGLSMISCVSDDDLAAMADEALLSRVLVNIADNSARYKAEEHGHLWIDACRNGKTVSLILSDDGPGVAQSELERLFEVFYRSDKARRDPSLGSGLGLAISRKMVERMGGKISAENGEHGGLAIVIDLAPAEVSDEQHTDY